MHTEAGPQHVVAHTVQVLHQAHLHQARRHRVAKPAFAWCYRQSLPYPAQAVGQVISVLAGLAGDLGLGVQNPPGEDPYFAGVISHHS